MLYNVSVIFLVNLKMENPMPQKCVLILLDGIGDRSYAQLDHQTPLQAAKTPVLDGLAVNGANGLYHAALLGQALPSENAHFLMFGYDMAGFPGRGVLEALGAGIDLGSKDVSVLSHFACLHGSEGCLFVDQRKPEISDNEISWLIQAVAEYDRRGVNIRFIQTGGIFGIIILTGDVAPYITDSDPFIDGRPLIAISPWADFRNDTASRNAASALKHYLLWAHDQLNDCPVNRSRISKGQAAVNGFVTQRAGQLKDVVPFNKSWGLRGLSIASGLVYTGLSAYIGMDAKKVADTGNLEKDIADRLNTAYESLNDYDFVHVHTKAPDEAAHTKDPDAKKSVIESLDRGIGRAIGPLMDDPEVLLIVTADHSTPSSGLLIHSGESVPLMFYGQGVRRDGVSRFNEVDVAAGALGSVRGKELMYLILNHLDRAKLHGIMDTPVDQPYWPGDYEPFRLK